MGIRIAVGVPAYTAFAIAPKTATPIALPIDRAKRLVPVTTPRSFHSTLDWAAMRVGVATSPSPSPTMKQLAADNQNVGGRGGEGKNCCADDRDRDADQCASSGTQSEDTGGPTGTH